MAHVLKDSQDNQQAIKPWPVYSKLRQVCKHLVPGHQEDAHEFLRYLVEAMERAYLERFKNSKEFDQFTKETTPLNQILGGYLKSSVRCLSCGHVSVTFQHFQDLLLDIRKVTSIDEALETHFARERLEDMGYKCEACKKKVSATKQFSLERAPISLCIQLKRFSMMGGKINKHVAFPPRLDLSAFSSKKRTDTSATTPPLYYRLVALVTHLGASQHCGHYTAIGSTSSGGYHHFDDSCVRPISLQNVLMTNAYIMFYELEDSAAASISSVSAAVASITPKLTCTVTSKTVASSTAISSDDIGELVITAPASTTSNTFIGPVLPASASPKTKPETPSNGVLNISNTTTVMKPWNANKKKDDQQPKLNGHTTINGANHTNGDFKTGQSKSSHNIEKSDSSTKVSTTSPASLPSMPKLDTTKITNGHTTANTTTTTTESKMTPTKTNGNIKANGVGTISSTKQNVQSRNPFAKPVVRSLVPYTVDDDSSDNNNHSDDEGKTTPIVKNQCGVWRVTSAIPIKNGNHSVVPTAAAAAASSSATSLGKHKSNENGSCETGSTVGKLMKMTHRGYGADVNTWNGQPSNLDKEVSVVFKQILL